MVHDMGSGRNVDGLFSKAGESHMNAYWLPKKAMHMG